MPEEQDGAAIAVARADELMQEEAVESDTDLATDREQGLGEQADEAEAAMTAKPDAEEEPVAKVEEEEEAPADDQGEQEAPGLDARLLHAAERMKWDDEKVAALGDDAESVLTVVADGFDSISARHAKLGRREVDAGKFEEPTSGRNADDLKKAFQVDAMTDEDGDPTFTEDGAKALASIQENQNVLREVMLDRVLPMIQRQEREQQNREFEQMEDFFAQESIQKSFKDLYGTGSTPALGEDSEQVKARVEVWNAAQAIRRSRVQDGEKVTLTQSLEDAHFLQQRDRLKEQARNEVKDELKNRATKISARPSKRKSQGIPPGDAKALQAVNRRIAELGLDI